MKSVQGLIIAVGLGLAGAMFNWMYLNSGPSRETTVSFVGIKKGETVRTGEVLRDEHLVPLKLPEAWVGNLRDFAFQYKDKPTLIGQAVVRTVSGGYLLLNDDLHTSAQELRLEPWESAIWIPVDTRAFVPSLFKPGDSVSFLVARPGGMPTPAIPGRQPPGSDASGASSSPIESIGPFTILALGNRLSSPEVMRASKGPQQVQENVLAIRVSTRVAGEPERADQLWSLLQATNFRDVGVKLHSRSRERP